MGHLEGSSHNMSVAVKGFLRPIQVASQATVYLSYPGLLRVSGGLGMFILFSEGVKKCLT